MRRAFYALAMLVALTACESDPADRILRIERGGRVIGILYLDTNQNTSYQPGVDELIFGAEVAIRRPGAATDLDVNRTDSTGWFGFQAGVGTWVLRVPASTLGDSLEVATPLAPFTLAALDTLVTAIGVRYPTLSPAEVRALPLGAKVWLRGIALNPVPVFGDSTVHVADAGGAIRVTGVRPLSITPGDSLFFLGTRSTRAGQPTLQVVSCHPARPNCFVSIAGITFVPDTTATTTAVAAAAAGGSLDAALVMVSGATISDTATAPDGTRTLTVDDGSGPLAIVLSPVVNWNPISTWVPGVVVDAVGVLVPAAGGGWVLKPRARVDLNVATTPPPAGTAPTSPIQSSATRAPSWRSR